MSNDEEYVRLKKLVESHWLNEYGKEIALEDTEPINPPGYWQMIYECDVQRCGWNIHGFNIYHNMPVRHVLRFKDLVIEVDEDFSSDIPYGKIETVETWMRLKEFHHGVA